MVPCTERLSGIIKMAWDTLSVGLYEIVDVLNEKKKSRAVLTVVDVQSYLEFKHNCLLTAHPHHTTTYYFSAMLPFPGLLLTVAQSGVE
jgi:hypothetical protein